MQIDWQSTIEEILSDARSCPRCGTLTEEIVAGYTHEPWGTDYAPRCQSCDRTDDCDARKLVVLCGNCARELTLRVKRVDQETLMAMLLNDCRNDLEECVDYLAEYWQDDLNVAPDDAEKRLEEYDPEVFAEERKAQHRLEDEYLTYHRWFRERQLRIPDPAWRAKYAEEIIALGYTTLLGD